MRSITLALVFGIALGVATAPAGQAQAQDDDFAELFQIFVEAALEAEPAALEAEHCDCDDDYPQEATPMPMPGGYEVYGTQETYGSWDHQRSNGGNADTNSWNNGLTDSYGGSSGDTGYVCTDSGCVMY